MTEEIDMEFTMVPEAVPSVTERAAALIKQAAALLRTDENNEACAFIAGELERWEGWLTANGSAEG